MAKQGALIAFALGLLCAAGPSKPAVARAQTEGEQTESTEAHITGERKRWHPLQLTFDGPDVSETDAFNPFLGYRLNVTFRHQESGSAYVVPGYFAADGDAADTGASSGSKWRVHFTPAKTGTWTYTASFRRGTDVAVRLSPTAGEGVAFNGATGSFTVAPTDKTGRDHRGKGMLRYVGAHYLRFGNGEWFLKGGADSPETLLAYEDFDGAHPQDNTTLLWGTSQRADSSSTPLKSYDAHVQDWNAGDPVWNEEQGKGLIGALNYLASKGMNAFSFLTLNVGGDGKNVWPWIAPREPNRYDVSKLAQWEVVFTHADSLGLFKHFKLSETENDQLLSGGALGPERKLYYRELVARFGHHHALNWNLGEENDLVEELDDPEQNHVKAYARYLHALDPYDHPVVIHSYPGMYDAVYGPLLGYEYLEGPSVQTSSMRPWHNFSAVSRLASQSADAGRPWVVSVDEPGDASTGVSTDEYDENYNQDQARATYWAMLAAGGAGVEWYFGNREPQGDLVAQDWRSRAAIWEYTDHALDFYRGHDLPFWEMSNANNLTRSKKDYVFAKPGAAYVVYLPDGGPATLNLEGHTGPFTVEWYNPRTGGALQRGDLAAAVETTYSREPASILWDVPTFKQPRTEGGAVVSVNGPGRVSLGQPPEELRQDWVVLVRRSR